MKVPDEILDSQDKKIDVLLDNLKELAHQKLREAYNCGAIEIETYANFDDYILPKLIVTLVCESGQYAPQKNSVGYNYLTKELKNLKKFI